MNRAFLQPEPVGAWARKPQPRTTLPLGEGLPSHLPLPLGEGRGEGALPRPAFTPSTLPLGEGLSSHLPPFTLSLGEGLPSHLPLPLGEGRGEGAPPRAAFTLVELLVVVSVILMLMGMIGSAVSAARSSQKKQATQALIAKIDGVIQQHYSSYASRVVTSATSAADRAAKLRLLAEFELPDNWGAVQKIVNGSTGVPRTSPQAAYASVRTSLPVDPAGSNEDAECLFMIVMQGGVADCLDCAGLAASAMGDKDSDGAMEFWDAWGEPIRYVRQPTAIANPQVAAVATQGGKIRPLIYSGGPMKPPLGPTVANTGSNVIQGFITNFDVDLTK